MPFHQYIISLTKETPLIITNLTSRKKFTLIVTKYTSLHIDRHNIHLISNFYLSNSLVFYSLCYFSICSSYSSLSNIIAWEICIRRKSLEHCMKPGRSGRRGSRIDDDSSTARLVRSALAQSRCRAAQHPSRTAAERTIDRSNNTWHSRVGDPSTWTAGSVRSPGGEREGEGNRHR